MAAAPPPLERAVALLQQRDGTDKALKAVRYGARLALALQAPGPGLDLGGETRHAQLRRLDRALGQSRKALRWGKFLGPVAELRRALAAAREKNTPLLSLYRLTDPAGGLAPAALAAEACYLFLDQAQFLVKAGLWRPSRRQRQVEVVAAAFEVLHLAARLGAAAARLRALLEREARLVLRLRGLLAKRREDEERETAATSNISSAETGPWPATGTGGARGGAEGPAAGPAGPAEEKNTDLRGVPPGRPGRRAGAERPSEAGPGPRAPDPAGVLRAGLRLLRDVEAAEQVAVSLAEAG